MLTSILQCLVQFQFKFAMGGATCRRLIYRLPLDISIHAPRGGSDSKDAQKNLCIFEKVNKLQS